MLRSRDFFAPCSSRSFDRTGIGSVFPELRCIFGPAGRERIYVPDLTYVARERLTPDLYLYAAPDLAIEILSPAEHMAQFLDKIHFYLLCGVRPVWIIDPTTATITVEAPGEEAYILKAGDTLYGGGVLAGFAVSVDEIFARIRF